MKKLKVEKKLKWVKPKIEVKELTMRSLLGENGWMDQVQNGFVRPVFAMTAI